MLPLSIAIFASPVSPDGGDSLVPAATSGAAPSGVFGASFPPHPQIMTTAATRLDLNTYVLFIAKASIGLWTRLVSALRDRQRTPMDSWNEPAPH
jgi:hypothetical protein